MAHNMISNMSGLEGDFSVADLIAALQKHRAAHEQEYQDALDVYRDDVEAQVKKLITKFHDVQDTLINFEVLSNLGLVTPVNCDAEYGKLINIFSMMTTEVIKLSFDEANRIFNNDWQWIVAASTSNSYYSSRKI